ncbi:MAG: DUF4405 domain-containing protein [Desulfobacterales bacterium]|nr:DUF4405 domain-containing protein [Desulfobacterales bacterium]
MNRRDLLWLVNVLSFVLLAILVLTGLVNWIALPHGGGPPAGGGVSMRHAVREIHAWAAVFFTVSIAVHVGLHWGYVRTNLKR